MKLLPLLLTLTLPVCAVKAPPRAPTLPAQLPIALIGKFGAAHACPVNGLVVTADHVAYMSGLSNGQMSIIPQYYRWEDSRGRWGFAIPNRSHKAVDMAVFTLYPEEDIVYYRAAPRMPIPGDEIRWVEYDFRTVKAAYSPRERRAHVVTVQMGHIVFDEKPTPGASGSCVFDRAGEVVGIISWEQKMDSGDVGVAVDVTNLPKAP